MLIRDFRQTALTCRRALMTRRSSLYDDTCEYKELSSLFSSGKTHEEKQESEEKNLFMCETEKKNWRYIYIFPCLKHCLEKKKSGVTFSFFTRETEGNFRGNFCFLVNKFFFCQAQTFIFHNLSKKNSPEMWNFSCVSVLEPRPPNAEPSYYMRPSDRRTVA